MQATERLYFNADKTRIVREGHKDAAFLYAAVGDEIPESAVEKFGLKKLLAAAAPKEAPQPENKEAAPEENKSKGGVKVNKRRKGEG